MDHRYNAQDVVRCTLCKTAVAPMFCEICHIYLCKDCIEIHLSDPSKVHNVVPLKQFLPTLNYPKCHSHSSKQCELQCEHCDVPICAGCISSGQHLGHKAVDIFEDFRNKKEILKRDLQELETDLYPKYWEAASNIPVQKADQHKHFMKLKRELYSQGEALRTEIDTIVQRKQAEIDHVNSTHLDALNKLEDEINQTITDMKQVIQDLKILLDNSNVCMVSKYKSKNEKFRKLPPKLEICFQNFQPREINREKLLEQFGSLVPLSIEKAEQGNILLESPGDESSPQDRPLLDIPLLITDIPTESKELRGVCCLTDEEIWTHGIDKIMKLYNLQGKLVTSVQTKSGHWPDDIAVTRSRDLVYTDHNDRSINIVKNKKIKTLITLQRWKPLRVCSTSIDDLLVIMKSDDCKQMKVVRYSGSTEKQNIQWDDHGEPLYSSESNTKYLSENRNLDICVADFGAHAVVVVNAAGKLRFRYTGPPSVPKESFMPSGIITDSHGHILTSDSKNKSIHLLDQDGNFLSYIDNCGLQYPWGLCVDSTDNLIVADWDTCKVKKIQYFR